MARFLVALALLAAIAAPAFAAERPDDPQVIERAEKKKEAEAREKEYNTTIRATTPGAATTTRSDPWRNMRGGDDSSGKR